MCSSDHSQSTGDGKTTFLSLLVYWTHAILLKVTGERIGFLYKIEFSKIARLFRFSLGMVPTYCLFIKLLKSQVINIWKLYLFYFIKIVQKFSSAPRRRMLNCFMAAFCLHQVRPPKTIFSLQCSEYSTDHHWSWEEWYGEKGRRPRLNDSDQYCWFPKAGNCWSVKTAVRRGDYFSFPPSNLSRIIRRRSKGMGMAECVVSLWFSNRTDFFFGIV